MNPFTLVRPRYFAGKILLADDFTREQDYVFIFFASHGAYAPDQSGPGQTPCLILYDTDPQQIAQTGLGVDVISKALKQINTARYQPAPGANYPRGRFGDNLRQIAQLIKAEIGLEVAFTDISGWDTHANQGAGQGQLALRFTELAQGISALYTDLEALAEDVVILTMTEFGRTAKENGNRGTDHGHASVMFMLGGAVHGGKVHGSWPGLKTEQLNERRDHDHRSKQHGPPHCRQRFLSRPRAQ